MKRKIYKKDRKYKRDIIPDKMEIAINIPIFDVSESDYKLIAIELGAKKKGRSCRTRRVVSNVGYDINVSYNAINKIARLCLYSKNINGNEIFRQKYLQGKPPFYLSADGNTNFVTNEEAKKVEKEYGISRYKFTVEILPDILFDEFNICLKEALVNIIAPIAQKLPHIKIGTEVVDDNTFSFQLIEMANDLACPKVIKYIDIIDGRRKEYDPTIDRNFIENLVAITRDRTEKDYVKGKPVLSSCATYKRGCRIIYFKLYCGKLEGKSYLKYLHGDEYDIFRFEITYTSSHCGSKTCEISKFGGKKAISSADDIRKLFKKLASNTHKITAQLYNVEPCCATDKERAKRLDELLISQFDPFDASEIAEYLFNNNFKIDLTDFERGVQEKIKKLSRNEKLFKPTKGLRTGDYLFKRELLEN